MARWYLKFIVSLAMLVLAVPAFAQAGKSGSGEGLVNKLLAPGPLITGHKDLEHGDCLKCHDAGQGVPDNKCLSCHTDIAQSIRAKDSFHANNAHKSCISCHSDHKGRNFNSTAVNQKTFNHALTGFQLSGAHARVNCATCHTEKRTSKPVRKGDIRFFGKNDSCIGCHKKDDVHFFPPKHAAKECSSCHSDISWKAGIKFDHRRDTGYALVGDHAQLKCATCHVPRGRGSVKYNFPGLAANKCLTCHTDHHKDKLSPKFRGGNCDTCHVQTDWKITAFNHNLTGFVLKGAHAKQACISCHKQAAGTPAHNLKNFKWTGLNTNCVSCHRDYHGFANETSPKHGALTQCQSCHTEETWKNYVRFNHNADTAFNIDGKHVNVKCFECHKPKPGAGRRAAVPRTYSFPTLASKTCETCHKSPHVGNPSPAFKQKCTTCHTTDGWNIMGRTPGGGFNHNTQTKFPLTGDHATLKCSSCHVKGKRQVFKFPNADKNFCESCHQTVHKGQFHDKFEKAACSDCHNTTDFGNQSGFNHNTARFQLTGEHTKFATKCSECHIPTKRKLPTKPPKPAGKFIFGHAAQGFCVDCHKNIHKGQFSSRFPADNCQECHTTQSFKNLLAFDHNKTRFKLTGQHAKIRTKCVECHVPTNKTLATSPPRPAGKFQFGGANKGFCASCHNDVHKDQFSKKFNAKKCTECHTTVNFTRRLPFDHRKTDFKIVGAHAKFKNNCDSCHVKTNAVLPTTPPKQASKFKFPHGKTGYCEACHVDEHRGQFHKKFANKPCIECHLQSNFHRKQKFDHGLARFPIRGKHQELKCDECHTDTKARYKASPHRFKGQFIFRDLRAKDCATCHKDVHAGRFGNRCSECHSEEGWDETAEYHKNFALHGVHFQVDCAECHVDKRRLSGVGDDCKLCHQKDDVHLGTQPDCQNCHTQHFWSATRFHHTLTQFPLRGAHRLLDCSSCHAQGVYEGKDSSCISCHFTDAAKAVFPNHKAGGFEQCDQCHNQFSFQGASSGQP